MGKIISSSSSATTGINFFGGKVQSDDSWLEALPVDVNRSGSRHSGRTTDGVWVSAGASYGAQVEFPSFNAANAFIAENSSVSRPAQGTARPRVVCDTKTVFVAAYRAAAGKVEVKAPVKATTDAIVGGTVQAETTAQRLARLRAGKVDPRAARKAEYIADGATDEEAELLLAEDGF